MIIRITRDLRTGDPYDAAKDDGYLHEVADIPVQLSVCDFYHGSIEVDDPGSVDVGEQGRVCEDVPKWDPVTKQETGELLFFAGQYIALTEDEIDHAREQAWEEYIEENEPEYSNDY